MKQTAIILTLGAIVLIGLPSCGNKVGIPSTSTATPSTSKPQTLIKAGSSSSSIDFLQTLTKAYESTTQNEQITVLEPGQSENIIAGIKQGLVDVGAISRSLKPEENNGTLVSHDVAHDALLVATHPSVTGVKNLTTENLKAIYSGNVTNWKQLGGPDAPIVVLDRPEDESAKRLLRKHYLGKDLQNAPNAVVLRKEGELIQTIQSTPYSIGAFSLAYAISHNLPVNHLSLNGIEPKPENVEAGKYTMMRTFSIVLKKNPSQTTQAFVDYILSPSGAKILKQSGFVPVTQMTKSLSK